MNGNTPICGLALRTTLLALTLLMAAACAGSAAAANQSAVVDDAVAYDQNQDGSVRTVEVVLNQSTSSGVSGVTVHGPGVNATGVDTGTPGTNAVEVALDSAVTPTRNVTVSLRDGGGTTIAVAEDVTVASTTIEAGDDDVVYRGETIALVAASGTTEAHVTIEGGISTYTGTDSRVFTLDTNDLNAAENYTVEIDGDRAFFTVYDLGLDVTATRDSFATDEPVEVDVESRADGPGLAELLNASGDVVATEPVTLAGGKTKTVSFASVRQAGTFTAEVTDNSTGAVAETDSFRVHRPEPEHARFADGYVTGDVGEVVRIPVELDNTDEATVAIGSADAGYWIAAEVTDDSGDGEVTVALDTAAAGSSRAIDAVDGDDDHVVLDQGGAFASGSSPTALATGEYSVNVSTGHEGYADPDDAATVALLEEPPGPESTVEDAVAYDADGDGSIGTVEVVLNQTATDVESAVVDGPANASVLNVVGGLPGSNAVRVTLSRDVDPTRGLALTLRADGRPVATATDVEVATSTVTAGDAATVFRGETVALVAGTNDAPVQIEGGIVSATGTHSRVYTYSTERLDTSETYDVEIDGRTANFTVYDLGLDVNATRDSFTTDETVEADVESRADGSALAELLNASGDVVASETVSLTGGRTETVSFGGDYDAGNYTIEVTDNSTGNTASTGRFRVDAGGPVVVPGGPRSMDPDDDGLYEDVNGNSRQDIADAVLLFRHRDEVDPEYFDFNDGDGVSIGDAVALFRENVA